MTKPIRGLHWFTNDLRLEDNAALETAMVGCDELALIVSPSLLEYPRSHHLNQRRASNIRKTFQEESHKDLAKQLFQLGYSLNCIDGDLVEQLSDLITRHNIHLLSVSRNTGVYENEILRRLKTTHPQLNVLLTDSATLFAEQGLPFKLEDLPGSFSKFRKLVEPLGIAEHNSLPANLPKPLKLDTAVVEPGDVVLERLRGGSQNGLDQLHRYFSSDVPSSYKITRNELNGWNNSAKLSPWLSNGSISPHQALSKLQEYERENGSNDSTYWISFELLWREYFQWYAHKLGSRLYRFEGIGRGKPLTSFYPQRFLSWINGSTPFPLVNACMQELKQTGFLSNRGRQIVASCFVNELELDWRYGAAYFEYALIDYDCASNWGNWQYIAGVGADPRGGRHFSIEKQTKIYDPNGSYRDTWLKASKNNSLPLDSVDAADWPL